MRFAPCLRDGSCSSSDLTEDGDAVGLEELGRVDNNFHWQLFAGSHPFLSCKCRNSIELLSWPFSFFSILKREL